MISVHKTTNGDKRPVATNAQSEDVSMNYTVKGLLLILHEGLLDFHCGGEALALLSEQQRCRRVTEERLATWR